MKHLATAIALLLAAGALAIALVRAPASPAHVEAAPAAAPIDEQATNARLAQAESELARLGEAIESLRLSAPTERAAATPERPDGTALEARILELERRIHELRDARPAAPQVAAGAPRAAGGNPEDAAQAIHAWSQQARDAALTETDRIAALRRLRGARLPDGTDSRLGVLPEMIRLGEQSTDARVRADVWRQLSHVTDPSLLTPLLRALRNDPDANVREEAAETLADFLPDANVRAALQYAGQNDESPKVRSQAYESLASGRR